MSNADVIQTAWLDGLDTLSNDDMVIALGCVTILLGKLRKLPFLQNDNAEIQAERIKEDLTVLNSLLSSIVAKRDIKEFTLRVNDHEAQVIKSILPANNSDDLS